MRAKDVMKTKIESVVPTDPAHLAAALMRDRNVGFLPVCDEAGKVLGALTDRDIAVRLVAASRPATTPVSEIMSRQVVFCRPDDDMGEVHRQMARDQKSRLFCLDEANRLIGVISLSDLVEEDQEDAADTLQQVSERELHTH